MSEHEQDAILGRALREKRAEEEKLKALELKARSYVKSLEGVAGEIKTKLKAEAESLFSGKRLADALAAIPTPSDVSQLVDEIDSSKRTIEELSKSLP